MLQAAPSGLAQFAAAYDRIADRTIEPRWPARTIARLGAPLLDRMLIEGADPAGSTLLAARACQLTSRAHREELADSLRRVLQDALRADRRTRPPLTHWMPVYVVPNRGAVKSQAQELQDFVSLLRSRSPLYARGIAMLGRLLSDGTGPVYVGPPRVLARRLGEVRVALNG
jgi:hypothetical protein